MYQRILKTCAGFGCNMYGFPDHAASAQKRFNELAQVLRDKDSAIVGFQDMLRAEVAELLEPARPGCNSLIEEWRLVCIKEKAIYTQLNLCSGDIILRVNVWYPQKDEASIMEVLAKASEGKAQGVNLMPDKKLPRTKPPTYIRVNDYTAPWQEVVNTYGIPAYQESNPALLTVVTFPFIFGMMYGDVGHGSMLLCVGIYLVMQGESLKYTVPEAFKARYMVLSLGIFATFSGFMYNDIFSIGMQIFESGFKEVGDGHWVPTDDFKRRVRTFSGWTGPGRERVMSYSTSTR